MQPSLSLIVPFYNAEKTLRQSVSRLLEVLPDVAARFEVLVVDNGSTDSTADVAYDLAREFPQVVVVRNEQRQAADAIVASSAGRLAGDVLLLQAEGRETQASELQQLLRENSDLASNLPRVKTVPRPLRPGLLGQLSTWGQSLPRHREPALQVIQRPYSMSGKPASHRQSLAVSDQPPARRPASFLAHLRDLALGE